jgi:3-hydroxyacyl-CoA dehydrogenase
MPVPAILKTAAGRPFYRVENGVRQVLGLDGEYRTLARPEGVLMLRISSARRSRSSRTASAAVDIGDGVACFEFTSKMNSLDPDVLGLLGKSIGGVAKNSRRSSYTTRVRTLRGRQSRPRAVRRQRRLVTASPC